MKVLFRCLFFLCLLCITFNAIAQKYYTGVWRSGTKGYYLWSGVSWTDFSKKWADLGKQNLRLINIKTYTVGSTRYFGGIWEEGTDGYVLTPAGLNWTAFAKFWDDNSKAGQRLINVETYVDGGQLRFLGVFRAGSGGYMLTPLGLDWTAFAKFWDDNSKLGQRLINIESYMHNGKRCYLGVFRAGSGGYVLSPNGKDWNEFVTFWKAQSDQLRLIDVETFESGGKRIYLGVWREAGGGTYLWGGQEDWECFTGKWAENNQNNLRLVDFETYDGSCDYKCLNQVLMPDDPATTGRDEYNYGVTAGALHCEGLPSSCPAPSGNVFYRWPNLQIGSDFYMRNSVIWDAKDAIFTLPFKDKASDMGHNGWMYKAGSWHHAIDYWKTGSKTFQVCAAAPGRVIHVGWDNWSGNTMVISHDVGNQKDQYRTIYMHLRNGPNEDCAAAWTNTVPGLGTDPDPAKNTKQNYKNYLEATGCPQKVADRAPKSDNWGTNAQKIDMTLVGKNVKAGDPVAWAGSTGPGGCGCASGGTPVNTHLHIFFAHRDPVDNRWYFFDPYGIYAYGDCYPSAVNGSTTNGCARYPVTWKGGKPGYAP